MAALPPFRSIPPSLPVEATVLGRAQGLLEHIDALEGQGVGALRFGTHGLLLVEDRSVCWAVAPGMKHRFLQVLRHEHDPPLERDYLNDLIRQCKDGQAPLVDALLATGRVSPAALRVALFRHVVEAIAHLALAGMACDTFVPRAPYQAKFSFKTSEILAGLGARTEPELAKAAEAQLAKTLVADTRGWAFLRDTGIGTPAVLAVKGKPAPSTAEVVDVCFWAASLFDVTTVFDDDVRIASASWAGGRYAVAWRALGIYFAATCENRAGVARLVSALNERLAADDHAAAR